MDPSVRLAAGLRSVAARAVSMEQATVTSVSPLRVEGVDGDVEIAALGWYDPALWDQVTVLRMGSTALILGAANTNQRPPAHGVVISYSAGSSVVTVACGGATYTMPRASGWTPTIGQVCAILWSSVQVDGVVQWRGAALSGLEASPTTTTIPKAAATQPAAAANPSTPVEVEFVATIPALQSCTWRGGGWRTDTTKVIQGLWSGKVNSGYWFYGAQFSALRGCTVEQAWIYLHASLGGPSTPTPVRLYLHGSKRKASAQPISGTASVGTPSLADSASGWYPISAARVQQLVDDVYSGVSALSSSGADYTTLLGLGGSPRDAMSGAIKIRATRPAAPTVETAGPTVLFSDTFSRPDSATVDNGWLRSRPDLGGGIMDGTLAVIDDGYDWFERVIVLPEVWTISWRVASTAPAPNLYTWMELGLHATSTSGTAASVGFGNGTSGGAAKTIWVDADGQTSVYVLASLPVAGDVVSVSLDGSGTLTVAINGAAVASMPSSGIASIGYIGMQMSGTDTGTRHAIDNFLITTP